MEQAILSSHTQFKFVPDVVNIINVISYRRFIVGGMGGSHLAADLLKAAYPNIPLVVHTDYGMPEDVSLYEGALCIASSYSGNTEESVSFAKAAQEKGLPVAVIAVGGALLSFAQENSLPYVALPDTGIQPRSALGYSLLALASLMGREDIVAELRAVASLDPQSLREEGERLAAAVGKKIPIIYASRKNYPIAYNWKIKFNETGKFPAYANYFPELNHNEIAGFDDPQKTGVTDTFHFIFITDPTDHPQIKKRMEVTEALYRARGLTTTTVPLSGTSVWEGVFASLLTADWAALALAAAFSSDPEAVAIIEALKKQIQ